MDKGVINLFFIYAFILRLGTCFRNHGTHRRNHGIA